MLHILGIHSMAQRYAIGAGAVYFLGFVVGGWWYARWWNAQRQCASEMPMHATPEDQLKYQQEDEGIRKKFSKFQWMGDGLDIGVESGDDPLSALIGIVVLIFFGVFILLFLLMFLGYLPYFATDLLAGYLAEILLEFVIGGLLVRRVLLPRSLDSYWRYVVKKTWLYGAFTVTVFGAVGHVIQQLRPDALTLLQAFH